VFRKYLVGAELETFGRHFHKDWQTKPLAAMEKPSHNQYGGQNCLFPM
jgi:hypothetical protein